jgi:RNA polymerase subunit RPABC4/transcription elongation factor Spt4
MTTQETTVAFLFLLLILLWLGLISFLTVSGAQKFEDGKYKTGVLCIFLMLVVMVSGILGWHHVSNQPEWQFLKTPTCNECHEIVSREDNFCNACGAEVNIKTALNCAECNTEYEADDKFCAHCGKELPKGE